MKLLGSIKLAGLDNYFIPGDAKQMLDGKEWKPREAGFVEKYSPYIGAGLGGLAGSFAENPLSGGVVGMGVGGLLGLIPKGYLYENRTWRNMEDEMDTTIEGGTPLKHKNFPKIHGGMFSDPDEGGFRGEIYEPYITSKNLDYGDNMYSPRLAPEKVKEMAKWLNTHKIDVKGTDAEDYLKNKDIQELGKMFDHYAKQNAAMTSWN